MDTVAVDFAPLIDAFAPLISAMSRLTAIAESIATKMGAAPAAAVEPSTPVGSSAGNSQAASGLSAGNSNQSAAASLQSAMSTITSAFSSLTAAISQVGNRFGGMTAGLSAMCGAFNALSAVGGSLGPVFAGLGQAIGTVTSSFNQIVGVMASFVEVANPGIMAGFNRSLKDLQATIGTAFAPFFQVMTGVSRQIAGELYPAMQALRPVFASLGNIIGGALVAAAGMFGQVLQSLVPLFKAFEPVLQAVVSVQKSLWAVLTPFVNVIAQLATLTGVMLAPFAKIIDIAAQLWSVLNPVAIALNVLGSMLGAVTEIFSAAFSAVSPLFDMLGDLAGQFKAFGGLLGETFSGMVSSITGVITSLMSIAAPFTDAFKSIIGDLQTAFAGVGAIFSATFTTLAELFKSTIMVVVESIKAFIPALDFTNILQGLHNAILEATKAVVVFAIQLARMFGNTTFGENIVKSLEKLRPGAQPAPKPFVNAPPENVHFANLESISKDLMAAPARAIGGGGNFKQPKELPPGFQELIDAAKKANEGQAMDMKTLTGLIESKFSELMGKLGSALTVTLDDIKLTALTALQGLLPNPLARPPDIGAVQRIIGALQDRIRSVRG